MIKKNESVITEASVIIRADCNLCLRLKKYENKSYCSNVSAIRNFSVTGIVYPILPSSIFIDHAVERAKLTSTISKIYHNRFTKKYLEQQVYIIRKLADQQEIYEFISKLFMLTTTCLSKEVKGEFAKVIKDFDWVIKNQHFLFENKNE